MVASLLLSTFVGCTGPDDTGDSNPPEALWAPAFDNTGGGALSGVCGTGPDDVWVVGGAPGVGEVHHFDGSAWSVVLAPAGLSLQVWCYAFAPDDAIMVGTEGTAARWDGAAWTALDTGTTEDLWGVFGFAPDDVWVVGGNADEDVPLILHFDGVSFSASTLDPAQNSRGATTLFKVWGIDGRVWAVGQHGLIVEHVDGAWVEQPAGALADSDFVSLWGTSTNEIFAVGGRSNARIATFDGTSWTTVAPSGVGGLNSVFSVQPGEAHVGGIYGFLGRYSAGTLEPEGPVSGGDVHAEWSDGERVYAVGGRFAEPYSGFAYVRELGP